MKDSNELFELCKQVYQATGWRDTLGYIQPFGQNVHFPDWFDETITKDHDIAPLYTSDYLLEKLPYKIGKANSAIWLRLGKTRNSYTVCYMGYDLVCIYDFEADTPLKALLRLTLKLHENEIL